MRLFILLLGATVLLTPGCGGGSGASETSVVPVIVSPSSVSVAPTAEQQFTASIPHVEFARITWSVREGAAGGAISSTGLYMAPPFAGTYHVVATGTAYNNAVGTATVTVHITVAVSPPSATITLGQTQQFNAAVLGTNNTAVSWRVLEGAGGGTVSPTGVYSPVAPGTFHVIATSVVDPSQSSTATVTVQSGSATGTIQ